MSKPDLKNFSLEQLTEFTTKMGLSSFRARQIFAWLYRPGVVDFSQMTDLSKDLRARLAEVASISTLSPLAVEVSKDGARKYGFRLADGTVIEAVLIPEEDRRTLCVSSQVGCAMGCTFCLTGTMGFTRNLLPSEIVNQVGAVLEHLRQESPPAEREPTERLLHNLVFMGMGEPLANLDNVVTAIRILTDQRGLDFSTRRITVSTCGLAPRFQELGERTGVGLAVSLHAADNSTRDALMPVNRTFPIEEVLAACRAYPLARRRRIMIEYILIDKVNDTDQDARNLARLLQPLRCKINLLPYNESPGLPYRTPPPERVTAFQQILHEAGYTVLVRSSRGNDISAACGQLAGSYDPHDSHDSHRG